MATKDSFERDAYIKKIPREPEENVLGICLLRNRTVGAVVSDGFVDP